MIAIFRLVAGKIGAAGALALALTLGVALTFQYLEKRSIEKKRDQLEQEINDPVTGYKVRLAIAVNNARTLQSAVNQQNDAVDRMRSAHGQQMDEARAALLRARTDVRDAEARAVRIQTIPLEGQTVCERVHELDQAFLQELLR